MYFIEKTFEISACHRLVLPYESKCTHIHGHNWLITVYCKSLELNESGMVVDFSEVKRRVKKVLDHQDLNEVRFHIVIRQGCKKATATLPFTKKTNDEDLPRKRYVLFPAR